MLGCQKPRGGLAAISRTIAVSDTRAGENVVTRRPRPMSSRRLAYGKRTVKPICAVIVASSMAMPEPRSSVPFNPMR